MFKDYFTLLECAEFMGKSYDSLRAYVRHCADFPVRRVGGKMIVPKMKLIQWMKDNGMGGAFNADHV